MDGKATAAPRFSLSLPMRYRPAGDPRWRDTVTRNVSSSGVLFAADEPLPPGRKLEIEIMMIAASSLQACRVIATSEVVRQIVDSGPLLTAVRHLQSHAEEDAGQPSQQN